MNPLKPAFILYKECGEDGAGNPHRPTQWWKHKPQIIVTSSERRSLRMRGRCRSSTADWQAMVICERQGCPLYAPHVTFGYGQLPGRVPMHESGYCRCWDSRQHCREMSLGHGFGGMAKAAPLSKHPVQGTWNSQRRSKIELQKMVLCWRRT